jgi:5-methylcytosine-specific restriction endonuclease McrA
MGRERIWSDDDLRDAVASSTTFSAVQTRLGISLGSRRYLHRHIARLELDTSHFQARATARALVAPQRSGRRTRWSDDDLRAAVARSFGYAETIRTLGLIPAGGNYVHVQRRVRELDLDTSHFRGQGWNRGGKGVGVKIPLAHVLVAGRWTTSSHLKRRLIRAGLKSAKCELCGWAEAAPDGRIPVELDHINGDKNDNRLENLRILCPNCHSLQPTHRGLNQRLAIERRKSKTL